VLVTGAAKRVGRVIALALAARGARVAVHYRGSKAEAEKTAGEIRALGVDAMTVQAELTREDEVAAMTRAVADRFGSLDVLVNNAAVFFRTPFDTVTADDWDRTVDSNLKAVFLTCVHAGRRMLGQPEGGAIVNIADWAGLRPYTGYLPYCVSKAGVIALTQGLARSLAPKVRVNAIAPGPVLVPSDLPEAEAREIMEKTPMKRHGSPEDVAAAVVFLIEGSDYVTGIVLPVDGGRLIA
jgi:NAD(P)-dependent dehydrogenase (short-subunit alcohol dehydrogenase family)